MGNALVEEGAFDLAAPLIGILAEDEEAGQRVGIELLPAPGCTSGEFQLFVRGGAGVYFGGWGAGLNGANVAPDLKDLFLDGKKTVESRERQGRAIVVIGLEQGQKFHGNPAGA